MNKFLYVSLALLLLAEPVNYQRSYDRHDFELKVPVKFDLHSIDPDTIERRLGE